MGNKQKQPAQQMKSIDKRIIVAEGKYLDLNELVTFQHGYDGLHIWEAGIVLARYVVLNPELFRQMEVLQLGSGVGIGALAVLKFTACKKCSLSDYNPSILENMRLNCNKNEFPNAEVLQLDWTRHQQSNLQYDLIIGSDVVYFGCPVRDLYLLIKKTLRPKGRAIIVIPGRKNYAQLFVREIEQEFFTFSKVKLEDPRYFVSPLEDGPAGLKEYNLLTDIDFYVYSLTKK